MSRVRLGAAIWALDIWAPELGAELLPVFLASFFCSYVVSVCSSGHLGTGYILFSFIHLLFHLAPPHRHLFYSILFSFFSYCFISYCFLSLLYCSLFFSYYFISYCFYLFHSILFSFIFLLSYLVSFFISSIFIHSLIVSSRSSPQQTSLLFSLIVSSLILPAKKHLIYSLLFSFLLLFHLSAKKRSPPINGMASI